MVETEKLVSICIPSYNGENFVKEAIQSSLDQTYKNIEIIIIDDVSTDSSWQIIEKFNDIRIKAKRNESNLGLLGNFRKVLEEASGEYLTILCNDDVLLPNSIKNTVCGLESYKLCSFGFGNIQFIGDRQGTTGYSFPTVMAPGLWIKESLKKGKNLTHLAGTVFKKSNEPIEKTVEDLIFFDWYLWLKLGQRPVYFSKELVGMHRYHRKNQTKQLTPGFLNNYKHLKLVLIRSQYDNIISAKQERRAISNLTIRYSTHFIAGEKGIRTLVLSIIKGYKFCKEEASSSILVESKYFLSVVKVLVVRIFRWLWVK